MYRRTSGLVWALAIVGLVVGGFVLITMEVLLAHARTERSEAFRVVQSSNRALVRLESALAYGYDELYGILRARKSSSAPARWASDLSEAEHDLRAISPDSTGREQPTSLRASIDMLVALREQLVDWSSQLGLADESTLENQTRQFAERIDLCFGELRTAKDEIWSASTEALQHLVMSSEREIEVAQLRILIAGLAGGALFLLITFFAWRAIGVQVAAIEASNRELDLAIVQARAASHAKSEFLANMSHEIRTPMNGVLGMTSLLLDTELDTSQRELGETVKSSAEALLEIINDILDFSKIEAGKLVPESIEFSPRAVVEDVVELLAERAAQKDLELVCEIESGVPGRVMGDPVRLRQVLCNLVGNAIKFTEKGEVRVSCRPGPRPWYPSAAIVLELVVADTGVGIAPEARAKLFQPFTQADGSTTRRFGGTGLGLAISRQLVELLGGAIGFDSELGRGTRFQFHIPFGRSSADIGPEAPPAVLRDRRVLVVDDHAEQAQTMARILTRAGLEVAVAHDVAGARSKLAETAKHGGKVEVIVLDMQLSGDDAIAYARELAGSDEAPAVVLLTPRVRSLLTTSAVRELAVPRLFKPVRQAVLLECLEDVLLGRTTGALPQSPSKGMPAPAPKAARSNVLLVEDNHVNQIVARRMLELLGHRVTIAGNGRVALELSARERFDVILMDCQMPELDGYAATRELRAREGGELHTPVVAMTAHAMVGDREMCIAAGMDDYLTKPVKIEELAEMVAKWGKGART